MTKKPNCKGRIGLFNLAEKNIARNNVSMLILGKNLFQEKMQFPYKEGN